MGAVNSDLRIPRPAILPRRHRGQQVRPETLTFHDFIMPFWSFKPIAVTHAESFKKLCEHCGVPTSYHHGITLEEYLEMYLTVCQGGGGVPFAIRDLIETALKKVTSGDTSFLRP